MIEERKIVRVGWPKGPWDDEPDFEAFETHGLKCWIRRGHVLGHLCGYVAVPIGALVDDDAHGGFTFDKEREGVRLLGFDCMHAGDWAPGVGMSQAEYGGEYRTWGYVRAELERIAKQIAEQNDPREIAEALVKR
jgi:hypothetical protein